MNRLRTLLFACVALALAASRGEASTPIFTKTYALSTAAPQAFTDMFSADTADDCSGRAVYLITVQNGDGGGNNRIGHGSRITKKEPPKSARLRKLFVQKARLGRYSLLLVASSERGNIDCVKSMPTRAPARIGTWRSAVCSLPSSVIHDALML